MKRIVKGSSLLPLLDVLSVKLVHATLSELRSIPKEIPDVHLNVLEALEAQPVIVLFKSKWLMEGNKERIGNNREYLVVPLDNEGDEYVYVCEF